jgi:hypothetical protein
MGKHAHQGEQLELQLPSWGGPRTGAGRKCTAPRARVAHQVRPAVHRWNPLLITMRMREDVPDLRQRPAWVVIVSMLRAFRETTALSFAHYSVQTNHLHLIGESSDRETLARGMQAFSTRRLAKAINARFARRGGVFDARYHARELTPPSEVRSALRYVLLNARHHAAQVGKQMPDTWINPRSTGATFDGWQSSPLLAERHADFGTSPARSWLLRVGWRRHGLLELAEVPGPAIARAA